MELREQHYVLALGKHHSIKKAAEALHVTPPTLSVFLSTLEHQLGTKLFDRPLFPRPREPSTWKQPKRWSNWRKNTRHSWETWSKA